MAIYDFFLSRNNISTVANYIGHTGRLFYDDAEKVLRVSDGVTPGGFPITPTTLVSATEPTLAADGQMWYNPSTFELWAYHNGEFLPTIDLATDTKIGGVKLGPGVITNAEGQIIIDSTGLDFSFGDFSALTDTYPAGHPKVGVDFAVLQTVNPNEDAVLASNGTGAIKVVGEFRIYPTNGSIAGSMLEIPVFNVSSDGDVSATTLDIQNPGDLGLMAPLNITINEAGLTKTPAIVTGSVAQFTGRDNRAPILVLDSYGIDNTRTITGGELVFRTGRGTNASTTAVQNGDRLGEVTAAGWASNGYGGLGVGGLRILANENFTDTARGSKLELYVIPNGTLTVTTIATVNSTGITMASGKVLTGNVTGTATTATNLAAASSILTGSISINPASLPAAAASAQTFTLTGLTTSHKIVLTSGTALGSGVLISAAWASAPNTLSIEFQNANNQPVDPGNTAIQYFAWV